MLLRLRVMTESDATCTHYFGPMHIPGPDLSQMIVFKNVKLFDSATKESIINSVTVQLTQIDKLLHHLQATNATKQEQLLVSTYVLLDEKKTEKDLEKKVSKGELNDEGRQKILKYFHALIAELEYKYGTNSNNFAKIHCEFRRFDALTVANIKKTISTQSISQKEHLESLVLPFEIINHR